MPRRPDRQPPDAAPELPIEPPVDPPPADESEVAGEANEVGARPDLSAVPVAGLTPRRLASAVAALVTVWIVVTFARQVGVASEASARAEELRLANAQLAADLAALDRELQFIQRESYIAIEARGYGLGRSQEIPFHLAPGAPPLPADAPGSAAARLGENEPQLTPLESWLSLLLGPDR